MEGDGLTYVGYDDASGYTQIWGWQGSRRPAPMGDY